MDALNLKTASAYLNNLLLARGLLRNGKPIEFARPSKGDGGTEGSLAQIINLVHDMVLRRDREQEQRESLSQTLRTLRTESTRHTQTTARLETRNEDLARQLSLVNSQDRSARAALRTAESAARALREEMVRMKATVQQIRTSCANDIRKRDVQIQRLKTHLTTQQRGNRTGLVGASIIITPGVTGAAANAISGRGTESPDVEDPDYSLRQETTEFLTQLSQSLSDENDNLIGLVRNTLSTLKEIQGLPESMEQAALSDIPEDETQDGNMLQALPTSYESLAIEMHNVLDNLRLLLTNPNFVPIEEVSAREEEILRLREGWEKMEARWREAVALLDGWRKRMQNGGDTVNIEELKLGLGLGQGFDIRGGQNGYLSGSEQSEASSVEEPEDLAELMEEPSLEDSVDLLPKKISENGKTSAKIFSKMQPLQEGNGNAVSPRKVEFASPKPKDTPRSRSEENDSSLPSAVTRRLQSKATASKEKDSRIPRKTLKRHSSPRPHADERSPKLTTQEKLNIAQAEAEATAVAAGLENYALDVQAQGLEQDDTIEKDLGLERTRKRDGMASRKTKLGGRPKRRKSTLTPEELEHLMFVT